MMRKRPGNARVGSQRLAVGHGEEDARSASNPSFGFSGHCWVREPLPRDHFPQDAEDSASPPPAVKTRGTVLLLFLS